MMRRPTWPGIALLAVLLGPPAAGFAQQDSVLTLEDSIGMAKERNLRMQSARYEAAAVSEEVPKAWTDLLPKVRGDYRNFVQNPRPVIGFPHDSIVVGPNPFTPSTLPTQDVRAIAGNAWDYYLRIRIDQPLFAGFRLVSNYKVAEIDKQIVESRVARTERDIVEMVKIMYFSILKVTEQRQAAEARVKFQDAELRYTEALIAGRRATRNALPPIRAALAAAKQEVLEAVERERIMVQDLKRTIGLESRQDIRLSHPADARVVTMAIEEVPELVSEERPDLKEAALTVDRTKVGITQAESGYYPQVGLFGQFEKQREYLIHPLGEILTAGVQASWTFWEWGRTNHDKRQAEALHQRAVVLLRDKKAALAQQAQQAYSEVRLAEGRVTAMREEVDSLRSALAVAEQRLRERIGVERDVTLSKLELDMSEARYRAAVYEAYAAQARLERVLGRELPTKPLM